MEFSGYKNNKKIFGLVSGGALATTVIADSDFLWDLPQNWSLEEASSVPYSYAMVCRDCKDFPYILIDEK